MSSEEIGRVLEVTQKALRIVERLTDSSWLAESPTLWRALVVAEEVIKAQDEIIKRERSSIVRLGSELGATQAERDYLQDRVRTLEATLARMLASNYASVGEEKS